MNITGSANVTYAPTDAARSAEEGIREQLTRLDQNVAEVARGENSESFDSGSRDRALLEQSQIVNAVRANTKSLEAANQALGTIIDIKV
jgi:hypothetical protein